MTRSARYRSYRYCVAVATAKNRPLPVDGHTLDHIVPVSFGFKHDIPTQLIGSRENLQFVPYNDNIQKGQRITTEAIALLREWGYSDLADAVEYKLKQVQVNTED